MSEDLATTDAAELEQLEALESQAAQIGRNALADERIQVPLLTVVQGTTKKPPEGANLGDFVNSLTGSIYGDDIQFLVAEYHRGRFYAEKDDKGKRTGRTFAAGSEAIVPSYWPEEYAGKAFADLDDAEERYSERANAGEIEWDSGPPINTTYNYTGFVVFPEVDADPFPVRLALQRAGTPAAKTLNTLLKAQPSHWHKTIHLKTERVQSSRDEPYHVVRTEGYGEAPELPYRKAAVELALAAQQLGLKPIAEDEDPAPAKPAPAKGDGPDF